MLSGDLEDMGEGREMCNLYNSPTPQSAGKQNQIKLIAWSCHDNSTQLVQSLSMIYVYVYTEPTQLIG